MSRIDAGLVYTLTLMNHGPDAHDVFISHAGQDKDAVARPLAGLLTSEGWKVWLDELKLTVGDSLSRQIDAALAQTRFGVVVLSPDFFANEWPQRELAALAAREIDTGSKVILPVWHNVDHEFIVQHSPVLADRLGAPTSGGLETVAKEVSRALNASGTRKVRPNGLEGLGIEGNSTAPSLFEIPTDNVDQGNLISEQPDWWEYRLYAGCLMQGRIGLEEKWQGHQLRLPSGPRREPDPESIPAFLSQELGWMRRQVSAIDRVFDPDVLSRAFGRRGESGDSALIQGVAKGVIQIYESLMDWAAALRNTTIPERFEEILELKARMVDGPVRQIHDFIQLVADQTTRIPLLEEEAAQEGATEDSPMTLTLTLSLSVDDGMEEEFQAAIKRAH